KKKGKIMTDLMVQGQDKETMSSREVAELTGKRHDHVVRDIEIMLEQVKIDAPRFGDIYLDAYQREQKQYLLPKNLILNLVTGYRADLRLKVINRWIDLENKPPQLPAIKDPALMAIMETLTQLDAVKQQQATQSAKLTAIEHNINYFDNYYTVAGYFSLMGEPIDLKDAKKLGMKISRRCKDRGIKPHKCPHPVYGSVNAWPEDVIAEVIEEY
ncbi:MAG: Rha family transcriptional regulator, partial [Euryarchaeota archaeon]|nr:Rha family transcriptional regulator [Euryarchaeota archaeon]